MTEIRTFYLDPDFRPSPKTKHFCCMCYRDLKGKSVMIKLSKDGWDAIHPEDANTDNSDDAPVGINCAKKLPKEFIIQSNKQ